MVSMQFAYYMGLIMIILVVDLIFGLRAHNGQLLSYHSFENLSDKYTMPTLIANGLNIVLVVFAEAYIVEKANKCLDFTMTILLFHIIIMTITYGFPWSLAWWIW
mmetsp:Transcript_29695/g.21453  ORF Transcript_29695/g.21453 Transcript_29695/m.21453 type:complete len:105 (+) Transcript_29695:185-499(+)